MALIGTLGTASGVSALSCARWSGVVSTFHSPTDLSPAASASSAASSVPSAFIPITNPMWVLPGSGADASSVLPAGYDSTHRLIRLDDVVQFRDLRERRAEAHRRINDAAEEMGLPH